MNSSRSDRARLTGRTGVRFDAIGEVVAWLIINPLVVGAAEEDQVILVIQLLGCYLPGSGPARRLRHNVTLVANHRGGIAFCRINGQQPTADRAAVA